MVKDVKIVVGLNYGDEGKGQMVDYFSRQGTIKGHKVLNVLSNGSAQRGHTVQLLTGERHVFKHLGSGTFAGADTYFPAQFLVNPIEFNKEYEDFYPYCMCHKDSIVVTPYHMMLNQAKEKLQKYGSCGMGVWEAVQFPILRVWDLENRSAPELIDILREIRFTLGYEEGLPKIYWSDYLLYAFLMDCYKFVDRVNVIPNEMEVIKGITGYNTIIFENGQGLLLDQKLPDKNHLTPSNTDLTNPKDILKKCEIGKDIVETCYVTRSYMTRHGNGPFPTECNKEEISDLIGEDKTNRPNEWQGALRYGHMDWDNAMTRIERFGETSLAITHINELQPTVENLDFDRIYLSDGPTRLNIKISS